MRNALLITALAALSACSSGGGGPSGPANPGEPNDTLAQATPTTSGAPLPAAIGSPSDVDFYAFSVPTQGATVRIQTFDASGSTCNGIDTFLDIYNSLGTQVDWDDDSGINFCEDYVASFGAGTWYVAVSGISPASFAYTIVITVTPNTTATESESNDTIATADGPFSSNTIVSGSISTTYDYDFFAVTNTAGTSRTVTFETFEGAIGSCPTADSTLTLYNGSGTYLASNDDSGINLCSYLYYTIPAYTTYYVRVAGYAGDVFSYLLQISFP